MNDIYKNIGDYNKKSSNRLKMRIFQTNSQLKNYTNQLLQNSRKVQSHFIDNIWGAGLADMQLISKFNKGIRFYFL